MTEGTTRRRDLRDRIVDAAARLLAEQGAAAVTTRGVAEAAGVQPPAIYRLFGDKDGLLEAVAEHVLATYVATKADAARTAAEEDTDPVEDLRAGWRRQVDFGLANPTLFALLHDPVRARHSPAVRDGLQVLESRVRRVAQAGRLRVAEPRAVALVHAAGTGVVQTLLATPVQDRDPGLAEDLLEAVLRQVLTDAADDPEGRAGKGARQAGPQPAAVALRALAADLDELSEAERTLLAEWLDRVVARP